MSMHRSMVGRDRGGLRADRNRFGLCLARALAALHDAHLDLEALLAIEEPTTSGTPAMLPSG